MIIRKCIQNNYQIINPSFPTDCDSKSEDYTNDVSNMNGPYLLYMPPHMVKENDNLTFTAIINDRNIVVIFPIIFPLPLCAIFITFRIHRPCI